MSDLSPCSLRMGWLCVRPQRGWASPCPSLHALVPPAPLSSSSQLTLTVPWMKSYRLLSRRRTRWEERSGCKLSLVFCKSTKVLRSKLFSVPSGPLGAVCSGERVGQRCGPAKAAHGGHEECTTEQRRGQGPGGCCSTGGSAAGGDG